MTGQQLKNSILQMAIQGKLVPQDPHDEPASVLLERIREEKKRLVKEKIIKAEKNETIIFKDNDGIWYEKFLNTNVITPISEELFDIPENWVWSRIFYFCEVVRGGSPRPAGSNEYYNGSIPFLKVADITKDSSMYVNEASSSIKEAGLSRTRFIDSNNLLLTNSGATLGVPKINTFPTTFNDGIAAFLGLEKELFPYFYYFFLSKTDSLRSINQGTAQPNLNTEIIKSIFVPLPPLSEQRRIVEKLELLMPLIESYGKSQEALNALNASLPEKLRQSILQEAIQGHLVPQDPNEEPASVLLERIRAEKARLVKEGKLKKKDLEEKPISPDEIPFDIPEGWAWCRIQDVITLVNGRAYKKEELLDKGKYKVLRVGNFFTNQSWYYSDLELEDEKYCYFGDLLYAWSASFGPKIWDGDKTIFHYHIWNVKFDERVLYREFLYYFFLYDKKNIQSSTTGSTMIHVAMENMKPRLLPLPPLSEQRRIVSKLEELLHEIDKLKG